VAWCPVTILDTYDQIAAGLGARDYHPQLARELEVKVNGALTWVVVVRRGWVI